MGRNNKVERKTKETDISIELSIDGKGKSDIDTGIGFFDHMLVSFTAHGRFDCCIRAKGDLQVDFHHTVEDTGIVLGKVFDGALGERKNINRFGTSFVPMDESLVMASVDISGRPYIIFDCPFQTDKIGEMDTELFIEFFRAFAFNAGITLHIKLIHGSNSHHIAEAVFKAVARALMEACKIDTSIGGFLSTKGTI